MSGKILHYCTSSALQIWERMENRGGISCNYVTNALWLVRYVNCDLKRPKPFSILSYLLTWLRIVFNSCKRGFELVSYLDFRQKRVAMLCFLDHTQQTCYCLLNPIAFGFEGGRVGYNCFCIQEKCICWLYSCIWVHLGFPFSAFGWVAFSL